MSLLAKRCAPSCTQLVFVLRTHHQFAPLGLGGADLTCELTIACNHVTFFATVTEIRPFLRHRYLKRDVCQLFSGICSHANSRAPQPWSLSVCATTRKSRPHVPSRKTGAIAPSRQRSYVWTPQAIRRLAPQLWPELPEKIAGNRRRHRCRFRDARQDRRRPQAVRWPSTR